MPATRKVYPGTTKLLFAWARRRAKAASANGKWPDIAYQQHKTIKRGHVSYQAEPVGFITERSTRKHEHDDVDECAFCILDLSERDQEILQVYATIHSTYEGTEQWKKYMDEHNLTPHRVKGTILRLQDLLVDRGLVMVPTPSEYKEVSSMSEYEKRSSTSNSEFGVDLNRPQRISGLKDIGRFIDPRKPLLPAMVKRLATREIGVKLPVIYEKGIGYYAWDYALVDWMRRDRPTKSIYVNGRCIKSEENKGEEGTGSKSLPEQNL